MFVRSATRESRIFSGYNVRTNFRPGSLRAYDCSLRSTCPPPATWGFQMDSWQGGSRCCCAGPTGRTRYGAPTGNSRQRCANCRHGTRGPSPFLGQSDPGCTLWIFFVPVAAPFPNIPMHVVETPGIRFQKANRMCPVRTVAIKPTIHRQQTLFIIK